MQNTLALTTALLLGAAVLAATTGHQALLEACVCVVNSLSRSMLAMGISLLAASATLVFKGDLPVRVLTILQVLAFLTGVFFIIQYAYFLLEVIA
jgi:hypothetical protein